MTEKIEELLDNDKCWEYDILNGNEFNTQLAAIELEKYVIQKQIEILEEFVIDVRKPGYKRHDILDKIKELKKQL